jgi:hypothetical protein
MNSNDISLLSDYESVQNSQASSNKVKLKITNNVTTKRLSKLPDSFRELVCVVAKSNLINPNGESHCTI